MRRFVLCLMLVLGVVGATPASAQSPPEQAPAAELTSPRLPVWAQPGEVVEFEVRSPVPPALTIGGVAVPLTPAGPNRYRGALPVTADGEATLDGKPLGQVQVLKSRPMAEVTKDRAIFRSGPSSDYERHDPVTKGVRFQVTGRRGDWLRVTPPDAWIAAKDVQMLSEGSAFPDYAVRYVKMETDQIRVRLGAPAAWQVRQEPELNRLWLEFPGVPSTMHEVALPQDTSRIRNARLHAGADGTRLELQIAGGFWGWNARWEAPDVIFTLAPPIRGLGGTRIAIDAGHGGGDPGAVGLHGMREKELNLACALALRDELVDHGAIVTMIRSDDREVTPDGTAQDVELATRVEMAENAGAQILMSVHHNAMASVTLGRQAHGTHIYYFHPHAAEMARHIAGPLARAIGESSWMHLWRSFALIRSPRMPSVLIEANFISNPQLEQGMLADPAYPRKVARGIVEGLRGWLDNVN